MISADQLKNLTYEEKRELHQLLERREIVRLKHRPLEFARTFYTWGKGMLDKSVGPRQWQVDTLALIESQLQDPATRYQPIRIAIASGHGIGKSSLIGMVMGWAMTTCLDCKIVVTANTGTQLITKTTPRVEEWFRAMRNTDWWDLKATSITAKDPAHERTWRADYIPWSVANTEAFQGLHNKTRRIVLIFDEASGIDEKIWEVAEGSLTDEDTEIIWLAFGNPTKNTGRFRECFGKFKHRWHTRQIDSRTVEGTNKEEIAKWAADWGEDSDFFRTRVRGEFPRAGSNQFIASDVVAACRRFKAEQYQQFRKILGVDVARFGDDQTVIMLRQGRYAECLAKFRGLDTAQVTAHVIGFIEKLDVDATVVDSDGIGNTVYDQLRFHGYGDRLFEFHGGHPANNVHTYFNRRAEIWGLMRDALKAGFQLPDDPELADDLTGPEYGFSPAQQIQLEKKDDMKRRGLSSPDCGDALAMTFAVDIAPKPISLPPKYQYVYPGERQLGWMA